MGDKAATPIVNTMKEVAKAFDVGEHQVQVWARDGMPRKKVANRVYWYNLDDIYAWRLSRKSNQAVKNANFAGNVALKTEAADLVKLSEKLEKFKIQRADVFAANQMINLGIQAEIKKHLTPDVVAKMDDKLKMQWYKVLGIDTGILFDKERLERGESTQNTHVIVEAIRESKRRLAAEGT